MYKEAQIQEKKNHELIMEKGEVDIDNQQKLDELLERFYQFDNTITMMKDYLNLNLPRMGEKLDKKKNGTKGDVKLR